MSARAFPTEFVQNLWFAAPSDEFSPEMNQLVEGLAEFGLAIGEGTHESQLGRLAAMAAEPHIVEFCPDDIEKRFGDKKKTHAWQGKDDGRVMVGIYGIAGVTPRRWPTRDLSLLASGAAEMLAYGWFGHGIEGPMAQHGIEVSTAYRVGRAGSDLARRLRAEGRPLSLGLALGEAVIGVAIERYGVTPKRIGLATYEDNERANRLYDQLGFVQVAAEDVVRPTPDGHGVETRRLYKALRPQTAR